MAWKLSSRSRAVFGVSRGESDVGREMSHAVQCWESVLNLG